MKVETKRLILQYKEYNTVTTEINSLRNKLIKYKLQGEMTKLNKLSAKINLLEKLQSRISDEMSFRNPIVWIEYKYYAYKGTNKNMDTLSDLFQHCLPSEYVCTKRFKYLNKYINTDAYDKSTSLIDFINDKSTKRLLQDSQFMEGWQKYEYYIEDGRIAKWENYKS